MNLRKVRTLYSFFFHNFHFLSIELYELDLPPIETTSLKLNIILINFCSGTFLKMPNIRDNAGQCNVTGGGGAWRLVCEGLPTGVIIEDSDSEDREQTQAEEVWNSLRSIHQGAPDLFSKPPNVVPFVRRNQTSIFCNTPDRDDVGRIRRAAELIRSRVHFPVPMHYLEDKPKDRGQLFLHTPEGELYEHNEHGWKLVALGEYFFLNKY